MRESTRCGGLLILLVVLGGCPHYLKLDPKKVSALEITPSDAPQSQRVCARGGLIEVAAKTSDGKTYYEGTLAQVDDKHFDPKLVRLTASIGSFNDRSWNPPDDAFALLDGKVTITATLVANPAVTSSVELAPQWACEPPVALASGGDGNGGAWGDNGTDGGAGGDGQSAGHGGNAPRTAVTIGYIPHGDGRLVVVYMNSDQIGTQAYVLDPKIKMRIYAGGGAGGAGGGGGNGGDLAGGGRGGNGGRGGDGGDGGDGGEVTVQYDAANPELANVVAVDVSGGAGGDAGPGGGGGAGDNADLAGQPGPDGRQGRQGRNGPEPRFVAVPGISQQMTASLGAHAEMRPPEPVAAVQPPPPRGGKRGGKHPARGEPVAPVAPVAPVGPPPTKYGHNDGERVYVGQTTIDVVVPRHAPLHRGGRAEVISTRTRKHHFTIKLQNACTLAFHRPPGERRHVYELDAPVLCMADGARLTVTRGNLQIQDDDTLSVTFDGKLEATGKVARGEPSSGTAHFAMLRAKRR